MKQSEIILSTVALTTVMMMSSLHFTSDVQAAERPTITSTFIPCEEGPVFEEEPFSGDPNEWYTDAWYEKYNIPKPDKDNSTVVKPTTDVQEPDYNYNPSAPVVTSYKENITLTVGDTLKISDLKIVASSSGHKVECMFSDNASTKMKFNKVGQKSIKVSVIDTDNYNITEIDVSVNVKKADAPTIKGVRKEINLLQCVARLNSAKNTRAYKMNSWVYSSADDKAYTLEKAVKSGVKAYDCNGKDITKSIKIKGYSLKYDKPQTVTYTVTDSDGHTTTITSKLYIKSVIKKMNTYMYAHVIGGHFQLQPYGDVGYFDGAPEFTARDDAHTVDGHRTAYTKKVVKEKSFDNLSDKDIDNLNKKLKIDLNKKYHVVGRHKNGYYMVELNGEYYWCRYMTKTKAKWLTNDKYYDVISDDANFINIGEYKVLPGHSMLEGLAGRCICTYAQRLADSVKWDKEDTRYGANYTEKQKKADDSYKYMKNID